MLSRQWERVIEYNFDSISLTINQIEYTLQIERDKEISDENASRRLRSEMAKMLPRDLFNSFSSEMFSYWSWLAVTRERRSSTRA